VWHTRGYCWRRGDFPERFLANRWSLLVDLMSRVLIVVVSTAVDGGRGRIVGLKLRWPTQIAALFRPDEAEKTMKTTRLFLYRRVETFLWWRGGWRWPDMGDRRRERESPARGERCSGLCYGEHTSTVHRCSWCLWSVGSLMERSCGCDWPDLQVDRTVRMNGVLIACDAVHWNSVHRVTWRNGIKA